MLPELIFYGGIAICGISISGAIIAAALLSFSKKRLNKQLDAEYGERRF
jgi:hypothetical protein